MKPAIIYAAKSTADKNASIPAQLAEGRQRAEAKGWTVLAEFRDEGKSAFTGNRGDDLIAAKQCAEELVRQHGECGLFIQHSDRLARGDGIQAAHLVEYAIWALQTGVTIDSSHDPETFAHDDLIYPVLSGKRNFDDSKRKSQAVRGGLKRRAEEKGLPHGGGNRQYGYQWSDSKEENGVVLFPPEAEVIRMRMRVPTLAGVSRTQIARELNADHIHTVTGAKWHGATISKILRNPFYKGVVLHKGTEHPGRHEPVFTPEEWQEVNDYLATNQVGGAPRGQGRRPSGRYIFRKGMLKCICGESMGPRTRKRELADGQIKVTEAYECYGHHADRDSCSVKAILRDQIDSPVFRYFERVGLDLEATRAELAAAQKGRASEVRSLLGQAEGEAQQARSALDRIERDYLIGSIEAADWNRFRGKLESELSAAEGQVAQLVGRVNEVERFDTGEIERDVLAKLSAIRAAVAGEIKDSNGADAARAAIERLFEGFALREPEIGLRVPSELAWVDRYVLEPQLREDAIPDATALFGVDGNNQNVTVVAANDRAVELYERQGFRLSSHNMLGRV